jgi:hypothetical protein
MNNNSDLIPPHGGYCRLLTYKLGSLIYDATAAFCKQYINCKDRTYDQMIQAARSGVANIEISYFEERTANYSMDGE